MLTTPRIVVVDDNKNDLVSLSESLHQHSIACLPIHFADDTIDVNECPNVRIIFADLHLMEGPSDHKTHFSTLGGLLEKTIKPIGPYFIFLWTRYPNEASGLMQHLDERLIGVTKPFGVRALDKSDFIEEGELKNPESLIDEIARITDEQPELSALFDWENRVLGATGGSVSAILELASTEEADRPASELGKILSILGSAAVGKSNVANDPFRAVNEAMIPILVDRVVNLPADSSGDELWQKAANIENLLTPTEAQASRLNTMIHIASLDSMEGSERGTVIKLPDEIMDDFCKEFNVTEIDAASKHFRCKGYDSADKKLRWVLVQVQAACDYAQQHAGSLPCYLGLDLPNSNRRSKTPPDSLWESPSFELDEERRFLHVNAHFPVSLSSREFNRSNPLYRLRESILNNLTYHLHSYGARPGIISFRSK